MAVTKLNVEEFLQMAQIHPILDVRSPGEYNHAHIPGAYTLPLFTDEERKVTGTAYKQETKQKAIKIGLQYFGGKMVKMVEEAERIVEEWQLAMDKKKDTTNPQLPITNTLLVHCWRGGMRSSGVAWLLDLYGFKVYTLAGGYKAYRKWVLQQFEKEYNINIVGGYTGSGKTYVLDTLKQKGEKVIDLESLANHKGSAFGSLGMPEQPSQEMFENLLANELSLALGYWPLIEKQNTSHHPSTNINRIWMEDESQRIGNVNIPISFFKMMREKRVFFLDIPFEQRLNHIVAEYGKYEKEKLVNAIIRIKKRLGGLETKNAINSLLEDDVKGCFRVLLNYYDKWYLKGLYSRDNVQQLITKTEAPFIDAGQNAQLLLAQLKKELI